jgi:hypothetical protein
MREEPRSSRNLHLGSSVPPYIKPFGLTPPAGGAMAQLPLLQGELAAKPVLKMLRPRMLTGKSSSFWRAFARKKA